VDTYAERERFPDLFRVSLKAILRNGGLQGRLKPLLLKHFSKNQGGPYKGATGKLDALSAEQDSHAERGNSDKRSKPFGSRLFCTFTPAGFNLPL
jgi:hypothetical protein